MRKIKTEKQIIKRYKKVDKKWEKLSHKHINSSLSYIKGHVTKEEHITGEKFSFINGWLHALEWVLNKDGEFYEKLSQIKEEQQDG